MQQPAAGDEDCHKQHRHGGRCTSANKPNKETKTPPHKAAKNSIFESGGDTAPSKLLFFLYPTTKYGEQAPCRELAAVRICGMIYGPMLHFPFFCVV
jgi:hypothetical protein